MNSRTESDGCIKNCESMNMSEKSESSPLFQNKLKPMTFLDKIIYTGIHLYIHLMFGLSLSSMSPAFVDFKHILNTEMEFIGLFPTFQSIGTLVGTAATIFYTWVNRQLTLTVLVFGMGVATILMPWSTQLWHLYLCIFIYGLGIGGWNGTNNVILIEMWKNRSPSILQFSQFVYGLGTIFGPLLTSKYVIGEMLCPGIYPEDCLNREEDFKNNLISNGSVYNCSEQCYNYDRRPILGTPFLIGGLLQMIGPLLMAFMYWIKEYRMTADTKVNNICDQQIERSKQLIPKKTIIFCITIFLGFGIMSENMYTDFSPTFFQYQRVLKLSAERSAQIFSTMSIALSTGRGLSVFVALRLRPQIMISYQVLIVFVGYVWQILGQDDLTHLWMSAIVICFGYSSIFICLFSFVGQYMEVTDKIGGLFIASYNVIYLFLPFFISYYIKTFPESFLYLEISCFSVAIIAFIFALIAVRNVSSDLTSK